MSKDEFLKIQTCVLKVNIHCDGCKQKVKKILQKMDGVYTIKIDSEQGKVAVSGNVDPATLIKKLIKNGKHAEIWGASKPHDNFQNQLNNQFKNLMIDNAKGGNNKGDIKKGSDDKPKGGGQDQLKLLQQLQQMKGFQDLKPLPLNKDHNQKFGKLNLPDQDEDLSDDEFDDYDDYDDDDDDDDEYDDGDDDEFEDDVEDAPPLNKMKPVGGNGHGGSFMSNLLMNSQNLVKAGGNNGGNGGGNGKKGGGGENDGGGNGGKKGGNQSQGGGKGGGAQPKDSKNGGGGGAQNNKSDNHGGSGATYGKIFMPNGAKKSGGLNDETHGMPNKMSMNLPNGQMGNIPTRPIISLPAVQGLPALNAPSGGGGGGGYFHSGGPEHMTGNPYHQQHQAAMMMNQRHANGNESFQPMIYARPPPAVNYMPSYLPYPYPPPPGEQINQYNMFSEENTSGCNIM